MGASACSLLVDLSTLRGVSTDASADITVTDSVPDQVTLLDVRQADVSNADGPSCDYCSTLTMTPSFCSDFDGETTPLDWDTITTMMGGTVTIESSRYVSCPHGLEVALPMITGSNVGGATVSKTIGTTANVTQVSIALQVYLPSADTVTYVTYFGAQVTGMDETGISLVHHGDADWFLTQNGFGINIGLVMAPLTDAWNQMTLTFGFGPNATITLEYTGADDMMHVASGMGDTGPGSTSTTITVGMQTTGSTEAAFTAYYDNIVIALTM